MKKTLRVVICMLIISLLAGCGSMDNSSASYEQISADDAKAIMDSNQDIVILDVRTLEEYNESHIPGAICIPNEMIDKGEPAELSDKEQTILVYCRSGRRSKEAAQKLADMRYTNIKEFGGIIDWQYETESGANE